MAKSLFLWPMAVASVLGAAAGSRVEAAETFRIAEYNVENYIVTASASRPTKPEEARAKVRESILAMRPDVLALEEMGGTNALFELQGGLRAAGLDLPYWEQAAGSDTNINVTVLSRFPITARVPHTNDSFLLAGRRFRVSRGFVEVRIQVNAGYSFTLIAAHLKSRLPSAAADEAELRFQEARLLRELVDSRLRADPALNLAVLGDFNDVYDSEPIRTILGGRGRLGLVDTRPAERNGDAPMRPGQRAGTRQVTWTEYYAKEDSYSRSDYIFVSQGMVREWEPAGTYVLALPDWGAASDHRPLVATFGVGER